MIRIRSLLARSAALAVPALALTLSLGNAPAMAAAAAPSQAARAASVPPGVTFHRLTLLNGWASSQGTWGTGDPRVGVSHGVVYLAGSLHQPSGSGWQFATLPAADRPSHYLYFPIYSYADGEASLEIAPNGKMYLFGTGTTGYSSLAGVSFPLTLTAKPLTLRNGWQPAPASYNTGKPAVAAGNGVVYLSGSLQRPSGTNDIFATLPKADRPSHYLYLPIYTDNGGEGSLEITPNGKMSVWGTGTTQYSSLAGISFPLTLTAKPLALLNGWQSAQNPYTGTGNPAVAVSGGIAYLSGSAWLPSGNATTVARLPKSARPSHYLYLPIYADNGAEGSMEITPTGWVAVYGSGTTTFTSLAGIHYPLGS